MNMILSTSINPNETGGKGHNSLGYMFMRLSNSINPNETGGKGHNSLGYMFMRLSTSINPNETGGKGRNSLGSINSNMLKIVKNKKKLEILKYNRSVIQKKMKKE